MRTGNCKPVLGVRELINRARSRLYRLYIYTYIHTDIFYGYICVCIHIDVVSTPGVAMSTPTSIRYQMKW